MLKKSLALSFRYDTHRFAATAKILIQIVAVLIQIVALQRSEANSKSLSACCAIALGGLWRLKFFEETPRTP
jgi:hypothetical protein